MQNRDKIEKILEIYYQSETQQTRYGDVADKTAAELKKLYSELTDEEILIFKRWKIN